LAHTLNKDRAWLYTHPEAQLSYEQTEHFLELARRREQREPIAYITGCKAFFGLEFLVNTATLIPRPETELLVETAIQLAYPNDPLTIADVGTGSGCIAISLAKYLKNGRVFAIDISDQALDIARKNAVRHQVEDRITFLRGDLLSPLPNQVDLIVSNPPYIRQAELNSQAMSPEVYQHEPRVALEGGEDGLRTIERLLSQAKAKLKPGGALLVEIGFAQGQTVLELAGLQFPGATIQVKKDLAGLDRLLVVQQRVTDPA
jgi:release factor glutamine methyltransferase